MKKWLYLIIIVCLGSCKIESTIQPVEKLTSETVLSENLESISLQANAIANSLVLLLQNDTIRNTLYIESGKGVEEYYWISFEEFQKRLFEKWSISFDQRINSIIASQNGLANNANYLKQFLVNARSNGFSPHLSIPNLQKLTNKELNEDRVLDLTNRDLSGLSNYAVSTYLNYEEEGQSSGFNGLLIKDNKIVSKFVPNDLLCEELLVIVAYRIVNPNVVSPCANGPNVKLVYNCIVNGPICKICNNSSQTITDDLLGTIGSVEQKILLRDNMQSNEFWYGCFTGEPIEPESYVNIDAGNKSIGSLSSLSQYDYYEPFKGDVHIVNGYSYTDNKIRIINSPILFKNYNYIPNKFEYANKVTLCRKLNEFVIHEDQFGMNELAGGIYSVTRLNGKPVYFYYPGYILGSLIFNSGSDNIINYGLNSSNSNCTLNQSLSYNQQLQNWASCMYCTPNYNSLDLERVYFVNTDKNFLIDYWYNDKLTVAISMSSANLKTPNENIITFNSDLSGINNCNLNIQNKTLVAELTKVGNVIDQTKHFNTFFTPGTSFLIEANVKFKSGKSINNCGVINTKIGTVDILKLASIIPFGNIIDLNVKVYKIN